MINCMCVIQEGQAPDQSQPVLEEALNSFSSKHFGEPVNITWMVVPAGGGFTAHGPSTSSVVSMTGNKALKQSDRVSLLTELSDVWMGHTGCSLDELVAVINDPSA